MSAVHQTDAPDEPQGPAHLRPAGALARFRSGRLGLTAAGSVAFARGLARTPAVRRAAPLTTGLRENADVGAPAAARSVRAPRWWSPTPADDVVVEQRPSRTPVAAPPRGLARAASRIDRDSWTPGRLGASATPRAVPMRLPAEVAAAGSMVTSLDSRRRSVAPSRGPAPRPAGSGPTDGAAGSRRAAGPATSSTPTASSAAGAPALPPVRRRTAPPRLARRRAAAARTAAAARESLAVGAARPSARAGSGASVLPVPDASLPDPSLTAAPRTGAARTVVAPTGVRATGEPAPDTPRHDAAATGASTPAVGRGTGASTTGLDARAADAPATVVPATDTSAAASANAAPTERHAPVRRAPAERHPGTWTDALPRAASARSLLGHAPELVAVTRSAPALRRSVVTSRRSVAGSRTGALTLRPTTLVRAGESREVAQDAPRAEAGTARPGTARADAPRTASAVLPPDATGHVPLRRALAVPGRTTARPATSSHAHADGPALGGAQPRGAVTAHPTTTRSDAAAPTSGSAGTGVLPAARDASSTHTSATTGPSTTGPADTDHGVPRALRPVPGSLARRGDVRAAGVTTAGPGRLTAVRRRVALARTDDAAARTAAIAGGLGGSSAVVPGATGSRTPATRGAGVTAGAAGLAVASAPLPSSGAVSSSSSGQSSALGAPRAAAPGRVRAAGVAPAASSARPEDASAGSSSAPSVAVSSGAGPDHVTTSPASDGRLAAAAHAVRRATGPLTPLAVGGTPAHHGTAPAPTSAPAHPWGHAPVRRTPAHSTTRTSPTTRTPAGRTTDASVVHHATPPVAGRPARTGPAAPATASAWRQSLTDAATVPLRRSVLPPRAPVRLTPDPSAAPPVPGVARTAQGDDTSAGLSILRRALARADASPSPSTTETTMSTLPTTGASRGTAAHDLHLDERLLARLADALEDDLTDRVARRVERRLLEESALRTTGLTPGAF